MLGSLVRPGLPRSVTQSLLDDGVVDVLVPMVRGSLTWMEAQQAARALCKLAQASPSAAAEIVAAGGAAALARAAAGAFDEVAQHNLLRPRRSFHHHADLLSRGNKDDAQCRALYVLEMRELRRWAVQALVMVAAYLPPSEGDALAPRLACTPVLSMVATLLLSHESWRVTEAAQAFSGEIWRNYALRVAVQLAVHPRCARLAVAAGLHKSVAILLPCGSRTSALCVVFALLLGRVDAHARAAAREAQSPCNLLEISLKSQGNHPQSHALRQVQSLAISRNLPQSPAVSRNSHTSHISPISRRPPPSLRLL